MKESFYRRLIDEAPFAHSYHQLIVDEHENPVDYRFIEVNDAFETITGIKREEVIGIPSKIRKFPTAVSKTEYP